MIYGKLSEIEKSYSLNENIIFALNYIKKLDLINMELGEYEIKGKDIFMIVAKIIPGNLDDKKAEQHKKYIDIQYMIKGKEKIGISYNNSNIEILKEYDETTDVTFYKKINNEEFIPLKEDMYMVLFPGEIHRPNVILENKNENKKVIIKINSELLKK